MKIAIALSRCHRFGSSRYVIETAPYFADAGHEVHIFANSWDPIPHENVFFHHVPTLFKSNLLGRESIMTATSTLWQLYHKLKGSFDVTLAQPTRYFTPDIGEMQFIYASWIAYKRRAGITDPLKIKMSDAWLSWMERRNVKKCKEFIVLANYMKKEMVEFYGIDPAKITPCHSGVNLKEFHPDNKKLYRAEIRQKYGIGENEKLALFVGNPYNRKGLDYLFRAMPNVKGVKLLVSGRDNIQPYRELASKLGIADRVIFNPVLTPEIYKYFAAADVFVFPTLYEPFGLVIIEAMASGLPVVTSSWAGAAELITDGKEGFVLKNPEDPAEIATKLNLAFGEINMKKMGRAARETAEQYTWERTAKCMLGVLERCARS